MVDAVLEQSAGCLSAGSGSCRPGSGCLLLAGCLFPQLGYPEVWHQVAAALGGLGLACRRRALRDLRRRIGSPRSGGCLRSWPGRRAAAPARGHDRRGPGGRVRRLHVHHGPRHGQEPGVARKQNASNGASGYPSCAAGPGGAGHPGAARRRVRPGLRRRDRLRAGPARRSGRGHDGAGRPRLRRRGLPGRGRGHQGGVPGPADRHPPPAGPAPPARRVLAVALRRDPRPGHRRPGHRHHHHRHAPTAVAGWSPPSSTPAATPPARWPLYHERREAESAYFELVTPSSGPCPARPHPRRHRPGDLRPAGHLPGAAHRHRRRRRTVPGTDPGRASFAVAVETAQNLVTTARNSPAPPPTWPATSAGTSWPA